MYTNRYLGSVRTAEEQLAEAYKVVAERHSQEFEIREMCNKFAEWSVGHMEGMDALIQRYGIEAREEPERLRSGLFHGLRAGGVGLLQDLQDLSLLATSTRTQWTILGQVGGSLKDTHLESTAFDFGDQLDRELAWLCTKIKSISTEVVVVPPDVGSEAKAAIPKMPTAAAFPEQVWAPLVAGLLTLLVGLASLLIGRPFLFPSLGPTAYLQAENPAHPSVRFFNVVVGHIIGLLAGFLGVFIFQAMNDPVTLVDKQLTPGRLGAAVVAVALTILVAALLKASHPPAAATTLLVALGSLKTTNDAINLVVGVLLIALLGELARRLRIGSFSRLETKPKLPTNAGR
jgi:hypothetical protein